MVYFQFLDIRAYLIVYFIISFFGLCVGSFLNVCIYRLPRGESLIKRSSHCTKCGAKIRFYDLVPVFSWLFLRGKCRNCGDKISGRYPLVESLNWFAYMLVLTFIDVQYQTVHAFITGLFFSVLIVIAFIDYDTMEISPAQLGLICILGAASAVFTDVLMLSERIIGALCVSVPFFVIGEISAQIIKKKTGEKIRGIELGDTLLMLCSGFLIGHKAVIVSAFFGIIIAAVAGLAFKLKKKESKIAFGPYLTIGLIIGSIWGRFICDWYISLLHIPA